MNQQYYTAELLQKAIGQFQFIGDIGSTTEDRGIFALPTGDVLGKTLNEIARMQLKVDNKCINRSVTSTLIEGYKTGRNNRDLSLEVDDAWNKYKENNKEYIKDELCEKAYKQGFNIGLDAVKSVSSRSRKTQVTPNDFLSKLVQYSEKTDRTNPRSSENAEEISVLSKLVRSLFALYEVKAISDALITEIACKCNTDYGYAGMIKPIVQSNLDKNQCITLSQNKDTDKAPPDLGTQVLTFDFCSKDKVNITYNVQLAAFLLLPEGTFKSLEQIVKYSAKFMLETSEGKNNYTDIQCTIKSTAIYTSVIQKILEAIKSMLFEVFGVDFDRKNFTIERGFDSVEIQHTNDFTEQAKGGEQAKTIENTEFITDRVPEVVSYSAGHGRCV